MVAVHAKLTRITKENLLSSSAIIRRSCAKLAMPAVAAWAGSVSAQTAAPSTPEGGNDIVVVGRKRPDPAAAIKPDDSLPDTLIKSYGADTIGEVLERLRARYGSADFSIVVNGRLVASLDAIEALPPEALAKIDVLPASAAVSLGVGNGSRVLNLQLRPRFRSTSLEGEISVPTDGGAATGSLNVRNARIAGERRFNGVIGYQRTTALRLSERDFAGDRLGDASLVPGATLVPFSQSITSTFGLAGPLGSGGYDLSLQGSGSEQVASMASALALQDLRPMLLTQRDAQRTLRLGATLNGAIGKQSWSLAASGGVTKSSTTGGFAGNGQARLISQSTDRSITATVTGPLATFPAGPLFATSTLNLFGSDIATAGNILIPSSRTRYRSMALRETLRLPILKPGPILGPLALTGGSEVSHIDTVGSVVTYNVGADWQFLRAVSLTASHTVQPSLPSSNALFAPVIARQGVLFYDDRAGISLPITIVSGGTIALRRSVTTNDMVRANITFAPVTLALDYAAVRVSNPALSYASPSALLESIVPRLFVRAADGTLLSYDSRSIVGDSETLRRVAANLHVSGTIDRSAMRSGQEREGGPLFWDVGVNYELLLSDIVQIMRDFPQVDVLKNPLSLSSSAPSRHKTTVQASLSGRGMGLNLSGTWRSGSRTGATGEGIGMATRVASLLSIGGDAFIDLQRNTDDPADPSALRLKLSITNVLDARPRISGRPSRLYGLLADPRGRTVAVSLRKVF